MKISAFLLSFILVAHRVNGRVALTPGPEAKDDSATTDEEAPVTVDVLANDLDNRGAGLTVEVRSGPKHGTTVVNADSTVTYTPGKHYSGEDSFTYMICEPRPSRRRARELSQAARELVSETCIDSAGYEYALVGVTEDGDDWIYEYMVDSGTIDNALSHWNVFLPDTCGGGADGTCDFSGVFETREPKCTNPSATVAGKCDTNGWSKRSSYDIMSLRIPKRNVSKKFGGGVTVQSKSGGQSGDTCPSCVLQGPVCGAVSSGAATTTTSTDTSSAAKVCTFVDPHG